MPSHVMITLYLIIRLRYCFFFSSRRRHTRFDCDWSSDVCSSDLGGNGRAMVWPDGKPEKRSAGKERRRTSRLFSEGLQLRNRTGSMRQQTKEYPARGKDSGGGGGLQGKSRMRILARSEEHTSELQSQS